MTAKDNIITAIPKAMPVIAIRTIILENDLLD
jgi:hypothetical protein